MASVLALAGWLYSNTVGARVETVREGQVARKIVAGGVVVPAKGIAHVRPRVDGRVLNVYAREGDEVQQGQVLAELETDLLVAEARKRQAERDASHESARLVSGGTVQPALQAANAEIAAARAELDLAKDRSGRQSAMLERGSSTEAAVAQSHYVEEQARAKVDALEARRKLVSIGANPASIRAAQQRVLAAQASLDAALLQVSWGRLVAPFHGVVLAARVDEGDTVLAGAASSGPALFEIADASQTELRVEVDEIDAAPIAIDLNVSLFALGGKLKVATGRVSRVGERIEKRTTSTDGRERDGAMVRVAWIEPRWVGPAANHPPAIGQRFEAHIDLPPVKAPSIVSRAAVAVHDGHATVRVPWGAVLWREIPVELGAADDNAVEIRGLPSGTKVRVQ
jgi:HlyD family secretion protein